MTNRVKNLLLAVVAVMCVCCIALGLSLTRAKAADSVIVAEESFITIDETAAANNGASMTLSTTLKPSSGNGNSLEIASDPSTWLVPSFTLSTAKNAVTSIGVNSDASNLGVAFWLYVADGDTLTSIRNNGAGTIMVYLGESESSNRWTTQVTFNACSLIIGWNELVVKTNTAWYLGAPSATNLRYIKLAMESFATNGAHIAINDLRIVKTNQSAEVVNNRTEATGSVDGNHSAYLTGTTTDGWTNISSIEDEIMGESAQVKAFKMASNQTEATFTFDTDLSGWNASNITFDIYLRTENGRKITNNFYYIRFAESETACEGGNYYEYSISSLKINTGWNQIKIRILDSAKYGTVNPLNLGFIQFDIANENDGIAFSNIKIYENEATDEIKLIKRYVFNNTDAVNSNNKITFNATNSILEWDQHGFGIMPYGAEPNTRSLYLTSDGGAVQSRLRTGVKDISSFNFNHTVLTFWMYISDISLLSATEGSFELGGGQIEDDYNEFSWDFYRTTPGLQEGKWHQIVLRIVPNGLENSNEKGVVNLSRIRFFRFYTLKNEGDPVPDILISNLVIKEMDTTGLGYGVNIVATKDFTEGSVPGSIYLYDMLESADGTFPQEDPNGIAGGGSGGSGSGSGSGSTSDSGNMTGSGNNTNKDKDAQDEDLGCGGNVNSGMQIVAITLGLGIVALGFAVVTKRIRNKD